MNCPYQEGLETTEVILPLAHGKLTGLLQDNVSFSRQHYCIESYNNPSQLSLWYLAKQSPWTFHNFSGLSLNKQVDMDQSYRDRIL